MLKVPFREAGVVGAETNHAAVLIEHIPHGEILAAVGVIPPFHNRLTIHDVIINRRSVRLVFPGSETVDIVFVGISLISLGQALQLPPVRPGEGCAVVIA